MLWQESRFLTVRLYNIWLPVTVCMTSVNYLSYTLLFLLQYMCVCVCIMNSRPCVQYSMWWWSIEAAKMLFRVVCV